MVILKTEDRLTFGEGNLDVLTSIPAGNWLVKVNPATGQFFLEQQPAFELPTKVYGDVYGQVGRYLNTFSKRDNNLGILLKGLKGTGKSLAAKALCVASRLPVILITQPYQGADFESFLSKITQECIIFIDEFEKTFVNGEYGDTQDSLLSIFDGVFQGKKLFLLTANNHYAINTALLNRPGRIHYLKEYGGLPNDVILDIINDLLVDKSNKEDLIRVLQVVGEVSMDIIISIIKEMNMYKETAKEAIAHLNIKPGDANYKVSWEEKLYNSDLGVDEPTTLSGILPMHPLSQDFLHLYGANSKGDNGRNINVNLAEAKIKIEEGNIYIASKDKVYTCEPSKEFKFVF